MVFKFKYLGSEAKTMIPRIAYCVNEYWKEVKFPTIGINQFGLYKNFLSFTDEQWQNREYHLFFTKNKFLGGTDYIKISFYTYHIKEIETNSSSENIPTQIIIRLENDVSIWINRGRDESVFVEIFTQNEK